jgi:hypothetical protein
MPIRETFCIGRYGHFVLKATLAASMLRVLLYWIGCYCMSTVAFSQRYVEITAQIEIHTKLNGPPTPTYQEKRTFQVTCTVGKDKWRIKNDYPLNALDLLYFDGGSNVLERLDITDDPPKTEKRSKLAHMPLEQAKTNFSITIIPSPGGHPLGHLGANIPWMAFCSGTYLKNPSYSIPLPTVDIRMTYNSFFFSANVQTFSDDFGLPVEVELVTSRKQAQLGIDDDRLIRTQRMQQRRAYPVSGNSDGFLKFRYRVMESTNFAGWMFPTEFVFSTYRADHAGLTDELQSGIGKLLSIREAEEPDTIFRSPDGQRQSIIDWRFRDTARWVDGIVYSATNLSKPPSMNDPRLQKEFNDARKATF